MPHVTCCAHMLLQPEQTYTHAAELPGWLPCLWQQGGRELQSPTCHTHWRRVCQCSEKAEAKMMMGSSRLRKKLGSMPCRCRGQLSCDWQPACNPWGTAAANLRQKSRNSRSAQHLSLRSPPSWQCQGSGIASAWCRFRSLHALNFEMSLLAPCRDTCSDLRDICRPTYSNQNAPDLQQAAVCQTCSRTSWPDIKTRSHQ